MQIFEMHITQKIIHKVHKSSCFYGVRKNSRIKWSIAMKICIVRQSVYVYFYYIIIIIFMYFWSLVYHYCASNILQRIKTVNEMWSYKLLFTFLPFTTMFLSKIQFFYKKGKTRDAHCCYLTFLVFYVLLCLYLSMFFFCLF